MREGRNICCAALLIFVGLSDPACAQPRLKAEAGALYSRRHLEGAMVVQDVASGAVVVSVSPGSNEPLLPLSITKLFLTAMYLENRARLPAIPGIDAHALIAFGSDSDGRQLALALRHGLGSAAVIAELMDFGIPPCQSERTLDCETLSANDSDADWANAMSLGETRFRVTPMGISRFLRVVANGGAVPGARRVMREDTAHALVSAMLDTVRIGSARDIRGRLGRLGLIGGKTGTGPGSEYPYDGIFAGLVFNRDGTPRYIVVTYVRHGGRGGGIAAEMSEEMAEMLLRGRW
jgi:hypothetical protein